LAGKGGGGECVRRRILNAIGVFLGAGIILFASGGCTSEAAPFFLTNSPMIAYRIVGWEHDAGFFGNDPNTFHGYAIVQGREITDPQLREGRDHPSE
jgi:hypothetical protein